MQDIHVGDLIKLNWNHAHRILFKLANDSMMSPSEKDDDYSDTYTASHLGLYQHDLFLCVGKLNQFPVSLTYASEPDDDPDCPAADWKLDQMHSINIATCYSLAQTEASTTAVKEFEKIRFSYTKEQLVKFFRESGFEKRYQFACDNFIEFCMKPCVLLMRIDTFEFYACNSQQDIQVVS